MITKISNEDCRKALKRLEENSIDAVITDPPYEIGFMDKKWDKTGITYDAEFWQELLKVMKPGSFLLSFSSTKKYHNLATIVEKAGFEIRDMLQWIYGSGMPHGKNLGNGFHTLLKPAYEPILLAQKPISEKNIILNYNKWRTGGLNIDACRITTDDKLVDIKSSSNRSIHKYKDSVIYHVNKNGRFPTNVLFDEEAAKILDYQSGNLKSGSNCTRTKAGNFLEHGGLGHAGDIQTTYGDTGGASRFFYCAKASKKERGTYNNHMTVKPIKLMKYLITLVTPLNGTVLDPFCGSGTTLLAAKELGFSSIGFENQADYYEIALRRLSHFY